MPGFPVYTQAVDRAVEVETQAASTVVGQKARHDYILNRMKHKMFLTVCFSKHHFYAYETIVILDILND